MFSRFFCSCVVVAAAFCAGSAFGLEPILIKSPAKGAPPEGKAKATAYVRLWKTRFPSKREVHVMVHEAGSKQPAMTFDPAANGPTFSGYVAIPSGSVSIVVQDAGKPEPSLLRKFVSIAPSSFHTILLRESGDGVHLELIDDSAAEVRGGNAELTVRNFVPDIEEFGVVVGDKVNTRLLGPGGMLYVNGLSKELTVVETTVRDAAGKSSKWTNEIDFTGIRKATVLIDVDPYGRIRPRVTTDGMLPVRSSGEVSE